MFRRRRAKEAEGIFFAPDSGYWELTVRGRYGEVLLELTRLLPTGLTFFVEGTHTVPLIASYLEARPATDPITVRSGTIWPRGRSFHMPMTEENMAGLVALMDQVAEPEVGDHLHQAPGGVALHSGDPGRLAAIRNPRDEPAFQTGATGKLVEKGRRVDGWPRIDLDRRRQPE